MSIFPYGNLINNPIYQRAKKFLKRCFWLLHWPVTIYKFSVASPRFIYALTPPPSLKNVGDQAQVVAILAWLSKHFPNHGVVELNKNEVIFLVNYFRKMIRVDDIILLHSGGNMGDRGIWSETARRLMIRSFPKNKIVSLPQTIYFSPTPEGQKVLEESKKIYASHRNLTIIGRDDQSYRYAQEYFPNALVSKCPDFVLSYNYKPKNLSTNGKWLFCLRRDDESALDEASRSHLLEISPLPYDVYDTTLKVSIPTKERQKLLEGTLDFFSNYEAVVTDRYHGLIFSVLCRKPTVVLPTVDHKLTSAIDWFKDVPFVEFTENVEAVPRIVEKISLQLKSEIPDWNKLYFDKLISFLL